MGVGGRKVGRLGNNMGKGKVFNSLYEMVRDLHGIGVLGMMGSVMLGVTNKQKYSSSPSRPFLVLLSSPNKNRQEIFG